MQIESDYLFGVQSGLSSIATQWLSFRAEFVDMHAQGAASLQVLEVYVMEKRQAKSAATPISLGNRAGIALQKLSDRKMRPLALLWDRQDVTPNHYLDCAARTKEYTTQGPNTIVSASPRLCENGISPSNNSPYFTAAAPVNEIVSSRSRNAPSL